MVHIEATSAWRSAHPDARIGVLELASVDNRKSSPALDARKRQIEQSLRGRFAGFSRAQFAALPVMSAYVRYYKSFDKTYHVLQQLESVVLKGRGLPAVSPLVDANFAAELETLVLTAGHDADKLQAPVTLDVSREGDSITQMNGATKALPAGDMIMRDAGGVCCSILYGQDNRSPITAATTRALYVSYAPPGAADADVQRHLDAVLAYVRLAAPACSIEELGIIRPE